MEFGSGGGQCVAHSGGGAKSAIFNYPVYILVFHCVDVAVDVVETAGGDLVQQSGELVLPLLAVREDGELERRRVQQDVLDRQYRLLHLHVVRHLRVSVTHVTNTLGSLVVRKIGELNL